MKKRLLITSIVMMLVVAVALSTATYAWFTSNAAVTANNITISAGTSDAPSLSIAWIPASGNPTFVTTLPDIVMAGTLQPIAPAGLVKTGTKSLASQNYYSASIRTENSVDTFNDDVVTWKEGDTANAATPYYLTDGTSNTIRLKNGSTVTNMTAVTLKADITGSAAKLVRIAAYKYNATSTEWELVDVLGYTYDYTEVAEQATATYSSTTTYYKKDTHNHYVVDTAITSDATLNAAAYTVYTRDTDTTAATATHGIISADKIVSSMNTPYTCQTSFSVGSLTPTNTMDLKIVIWLDGLALNDETQGFTGNINLTFTATSAS